MKAGTLVELGKATFRQVRKDKIYRLGASLAFFTVLTLVPLFVFASAFIAHVLGHRAAMEQTVRQVEETFGKPLGQVFAQMFHETHSPLAAGLSTFVGIATLVYGVFRAFGELEGSLNVIFGVSVQQEPGLWGTIRKRFLSVQVIVGALLFLFVSLLAPVAFHALADWLADVLLGGPLLWRAVHAVIVYWVVLLLFALIYKVMPDARIAWKDVWVGAGLTALLFLVGKFFLSEYLREESLPASYGVARSVLVMLLWVYYSCELLLLGAAFTRAYAERFGDGVAPADNAVRRA